MTFRTLSKIPNPIKITVCYSSPLNIFGPSSRRNLAQSQREIKPNPQRLLNSSYHQPSLAVKCTCENFIAQPESAIFRPFGAILSAIFC